MADILIKGMEMPKRCYDCQFCDIDEGFYCMATDDEHSIDRMTWIRRRPKWCPLVEVKPHGDLIDRDVAMTAFADRMCVDDILNGVYEPAVEVLRSAPTVLEASE